MKEYIPKNIFRTQQLIKKSREKLSPPMKLCSLPPTTETLNLHVLLVYYQCILWQYLMLSDWINLNPCNLSFLWFLVDIWHCFKVYTTSTWRFVIAFSFCHCLYYLCQFATWQNVINISQLHKSAIAKIQVFVVAVNNVILLFILNL